MGAMRSTAGWVLAAALAMSACSAAGGDEVASPVAHVPAATTTTAAPTTTTSTSSTTTTASPPPPRAVHEQAWTPFATVGGITLVHPSARVEHVGFHQANHDGARELTALATAAAPAMLESRERETPSSTAADVVVDPATEIRSPVTGTVKRGGGYTLYCKYRDDFVVIDPDQHPGWEVKVLHINGLQVRRGQRVEAGRTVIAPGPTQLPFPSQVDEIRTAEPAWPHVHIEVVDPSIRDRPSPGGGCS
jgi:biotin carboxyl carrier protein